VRGKKGGSEGGGAGYLRRLIGGIKSRDKAGSNRRPFPVRERKGLPGKKNLTGWVHLSAR
jgi:hypothetical protein